MKDPQDDITVDWLFSNDTWSDYPKVIREYSERDYPEDRHDENGGYIRPCIKCNQIFIGYKRRTVCKKCLTNSEELA